MATCCCWYLEIALGEHPVWHKEQFKVGACGPVPRNLLGLTSTVGHRAAQGLCMQPRMREGRKVQVQ